MIETVEKRLEESKNNNTTKHHTKEYDYFNKLLYGILEDQTLDKRELYYRCVSELQRYSYVSCACISNYIFSKEYDYTVCCLDSEGKYDKLEDYRKRDCRFNDEQV